MVKQSLLFSSIIVAAVGGVCTYAMSSSGGGNGMDNQPGLEAEVRHMSDSLFQPVEMEDLLDEKVYLDLAKEGWTGTEIVNIMKQAVADKKTAHYKDGYVHYAKEVVPLIRRMIGGDTLAMIMDTVYTPMMRRSVEATVPTDLLNAYYPPLEYFPPKDRPGTARKAGYFRRPTFNPSCGRICWMTIHPDDPDKLYVAPDGAGIFKTDDCGDHWECITDRIPDRANRSNVNGYAIPVDPDDWDHVFAFMNNSAVYETCDGGQSWRRIQGATHKGFKRGDCFRDAEGTLKFIGCTTQSWSSTLWISEDTCKTWTAVQVPDSIKDINPQNGARGLWFQYIVPDPTDRNKIYLPTSRSILYFDDGAKSEMVDGKRVYNIKKMHFSVFDEQGNRRYANHPNDRAADVNNDAIFPIPANCVGDLVINPNSPNQWWFASGTNCVGMGDCTAVYKSEDSGKTWTTLQDVAFGIGSGNVFGNELAAGWLGGFGVNFTDQSKVYGCSMSSAKSGDGGRTFQNYHWAIALAAKDPDGRYVTVSASRHNADNHCIRSHKSGRVFRGSDGGMLMIDPTINNGEWTQIGSDMGQMLFYHVAVNEFGDQVIAGNTQDIDGQTYRYGRWGTWRGYEGSESWINPYTGAVYFSGMGYIGWQDMPISSWYNAMTRADVVSGSWFLTRAGISGMSFLRCDDLGKTTVRLEPKVGESIGWSGKFGLCRDKGRTTIYVVTSSNTIKRSIDLGETFEPVMFNDQPAKFSGTVIATNPDNSDVLYLGQQGHVYCYYVNESRFEEIGSGLPNVPCSQLLYHEGSGDIYFVHSGSAGIYILESQGKDDKGIDIYNGPWRFWTQGYNSGKLGNVEINYTTQEMVLCDYGRGVWCADLEHPSDRFFDEGFALKEYSFKDGRRTIGIDTDWTIPLYYYYKWTVNGEVVDNPYQYLRRVLNPGDRVTLELTLRESPDVTTKSAVFVVPEVSDPHDDLAAGQGDAATATDNQGNASQGDGSVDIPVAREPGMALYSNGSGRIDLGYYDYFFNDFTIDFWLKPISDGTILANRTREGDNKGWELSLESGALRLDYSPMYSFNQPRYETGVTQTATVRGGAVNYGGWQHVAMTHQRNGEIVLYLNGKRVASGMRIRPEATLNSAMILSLFGDGIEYRTMEATIDELKIWTTALSEEQVRREMHSTNADNKDGLVAYWSFNSGKLENDLETFSRKAPKSRVLAETTHRMMNVPTCAHYVSYQEAAPGKHIFRSGDTDILGFSAITDADAVAAAAEGTGTSGGKYGVYVFDASQWQNEEDNLDTDYFDYHKMGYLIHPFDGISDDKLAFDFYPVEEEFNPDKTYRIYASGSDGDKQVWEQVGNAAYNAESGSIRLTDATLSQIVDKKLLIVTTRPSIEVKIEGIGPDGVLPIYDETQSTYPMSANILGNLSEPAGVYEIESDGILKASGLYFAEGKATGELRLDLTKLGALNTSVKTTLRGTSTYQSDTASKVPPSMIPLNIEVRNRIAPRTAGTAIKINNGFAGVGSTNNYKSILSKNEFTIMGWVRIDSARVFQGERSLMAFRDNTGNTGLALRNGAPLLRQNSENVWCDESFKLTADEDLGRWHHLALVYGDAVGIEFYIDGMPLRNSGWKRVTNRGVGGFYLGKNSGMGSSNNDDNFVGAFDQVAAWNRCLTQDEIIKYMYTGVPLNDSDLLTYLNMDYTDEDGRVRDVYNCEELITTPTAVRNGSITFDEPTPIPFDAKAFYNVSDPESPVSIEFPSGKMRNATISVFRGAPYCYLNHDFQQYSALNQEFYGITYKERLTNAKRPTETDSVTMIYCHRSILDGEHLAVAFRRTGTLEHLAGFIPAKSVEEGVARFRVPLSYLTEASEFMFFTYPDEEGGAVTERPAMLQLSFPQSVLSKLNTDEEIPTLVLSGEEESIAVIADVMALSRNYDVPVRIVVNESTYATPSQETIDFSTAENRFNINIDVDKMNKFGVNPITLNLSGANANELKLNVIFEPYVLLTLENGDNRDIVTPGQTTQGGGADKARRRGKSRAAAEAQSGNNTFRTTTPIANLEVSAELLQGYLPEGEQVKLEVISELDNSLSIGNGNLLKDESVTYDPLVHYSSEEGSFHEGWNLIGNPYLTNINLTKSQNVDFNPETVTKFLYQCDPATGNYQVYDMTDYNDSHRIHPFQSYFVQAMEDKAEFTVTPVAKEVEPTKRTRAYKVSEKQSLTLGLSGDDKTYDSVTLNFDEDAESDFKTNEDAPKMWNISGSSPELYAMTADDKETTVSTTGANQIDLGLKSPGDQKLRLQLLAAEGLEGREIVIHDNVTGSEWNPETDGDTYEFTAVPGKNNDRFTVNVSTPILTVAGSATADNYKVYVEDHLCTVEGLNGDAVIRIYTPNGLNLITQQVATPTFSTYLESGVYIVAIRENRKDYTSKIVVQ